MPPAIADGPLGLEALHKWTPPQGIVAGGIPDLTLNDQTALFALTSGYAYDVTSIGGLFSLPDITDEREPALGRIGELVYDAQDGGKTVTYSGAVYGATLQDMREGVTVLRRTFGAKSREAGAVHALAQVGEGMMTISPNEVYGGEDPVEHIFFARAQTLEVGEEQVDGPGRQPTPFRRAFVLTLRLADPRAYVVAGVHSEGHSDGESVFLTNLGVEPTDPVFKLQGAFGTDPLVIARGTDYVLAFTGMNGIADGLWVDFKARRAWLNDDGSDMTAHLSEGQSNWWDPGIQGLDPGDNDIGVTGIGVDGTWEVFFWHAN